MEKTIYDKCPGISEQMEAPAVVQVVVNEDHTPFQSGIAFNEI